MYYRIIDKEIVPAETALFSTPEQGVGFLTLAEAENRREELGIDDYELELCRRHTRHLHAGIETRGDRSIILINAINRGNTDEFDRIAFLLRRNKLLLVQIEDADDSAKLGFEDVIKRRAGDAAYEAVVYDLFAQFLASGEDLLDGTEEEIAAMGLAGADRVFRLMDEPSETDEGCVTLVQAKKIGGQIAECPEHTGLWAWKHDHKAGDTTAYTELRGDIVMEGVNFGYDADKPVLYDINLYARPGQKIAFVGSTGAGKTTITNLINRFYDIQDGRIRCDGIDICKIKKDDLRRSLGIVLQDTHLFTGSVRDNIRYGKLDASDADVEAAARLANADGFITRLPQGYDTRLTGDGANLSQGQRQLIAIARAAVADPPVLILDEATSSIDTRTEKLVQQGML